MLRPRTRRRVDRGARRRAGAPLRRRPTPQVDGGADRARRGDLDADPTSDGGALPDAFERVASEVGLAAVDLDAGGPRRELGNRTAPGAEERALRLRPLRARSLRHPAGRRRSPVRDQRERALAARGRRLHRASTTGRSAPACGGCSPRRSPPRLARRAADAPRHGRGRPRALRRRRRDHPRAAESAPPAGRTSRRSGSTTRTASSSVPTSRSARSRRRSFDERTGARRDHVRLALNGVVHEVRGDDAFLTLSTWLRERQRLVGTKIVCSEGDCGACTRAGRARSGPNRPAISPGRRRLAYRAIDSCIAFLYQLDGCHVVTVDALARRSMRASSSTRCSARWSRSYGSQCGFCTPGFVMALAGSPRKRERERQRPPDAELAPRPLRQSLPLHRLRPDPRRRARGRAARRRRRSPTSSTRRSLVAGARRRAGPRRCASRRRRERSVSLPASWRGGARAPRARACRRRRRRRDRSRRARSTRAARCPTAFSTCARTSTGTRRHRRGRRRAARRRRALDAMSWRALRHALRRSSRASSSSSARRRSATSARSAATSSTPRRSPTRCRSSTSWRRGLELDSTRGRRDGADRRLLPRLQASSTSRPDELLVGGASCRCPAPARAFACSKSRAGATSTSPTFTAALWLAAREASGSSARASRLGGVGRTVVRAPRGGGEPRRLRRSSSPRSLRRGRQLAAARDPRRFRRPRRAPPTGAYSGRNALVPLLPRPRRTRTAPALGAGIAGP